MNKQNSDLLFVLIGLILALITGSFVGYATQNAFLSLFVVVLIYGLWASVFVLGREIRETYDE